MDERRRNEDSRLEVLTERVENWMQSTTEYRKSLCTKIDGLNTKLDNMPCSKGHDIHVDRQLGAIWWIVSVCMVGIVSVAVAWGSLSTTVERNTQKWDAHDQVYGVQHGKRS